MGLGDENLEAILLTLVQQLLDKAGKEGRGRLCRAVVLNLGQPRCSWLAIPKSLHHQLCWLGFLGVTVQEYLGYPRLGITGVEQYD